MTLLSQQKLNCCSRTHTWRTYTNRRGVTSPPSQLWAVKPMCIVKSSIIQQQQHTQQKKKKAGRHQSRIDLTQVLWLYTVPGSEYIVHSINILQRVFYIYSRDQSIYDFNIVMVGLVFVYIYVCWKWTASLTFRSCSFVIFSGSLGVSNELDRRIAAVPVVRGDDIRWRRTRFSSTRVRQ